MYGEISNSKIKMNIMRNKLDLILSAVLTMALFAGACADKNAVEANKFVESANKKSQEAKDMVDKMPKHSEFEVF